MFKLLTNANVFAPRALGLKTILVCAGKIVYLGDAIPTLDPDLDIEYTDLAGALVVPGLIDGHTHITGGGGESGADLFDFEVYAGVASGSFGKGAGLFEGAGFYESVDRRESIVDSR